MNIPVAASSSSELRLFVLLGRQREHAESIFAVFWGDNFERTGDEVHDGRSGIAANAMPFRSYSGRDLPSLTGIIPLIMAKWMLSQGMETSWCLSK